MLLRMIWPTKTSHDKTTELD